MMRKRVMMTKLEKLQHRWLLKTGEPMPDAIVQLPIERIVRAVELTEAGETVFVPSSAPVLSENRDGYGFGDSMREWDGDSFH